MDGYGGAAPPTVRLAPEDSFAADVAVHLLAATPSSFSSSSSPSLTVLAPVSWLSRVPYFAAKLKEPWCQATPSSQQLQITLECTSGSSPAAYLRCFRLLDTSQPCSPRMFASITEILELLPVADHLLFQECWDVCMEFLAATPWSDEEEDAIRATIAVLNLKPSCDVYERLDTSQDVGSLETMLRHMVSSPSMEGPLAALSQECLQSSPARIKEVFHSLMLKMQASYIVKGSSLPSYIVKVSSLPREWYVLTKLLLQFTDAHEVIAQLIDSQEVFSSLLCPRTVDREKDSKYIINEALQKVFLRVVPLSNSQRALLVARLNAASVRYKDMAFESMRQRLAETLPLSHSVRMDLVKGSHELNSAWFHQLFRRIDHWDGQQVEALYDRKLGSEGNIIA